MTKRDPLHTARFESPYPESWSKISHFEFDTPLWLVRATEAIKGAEDSDRETQYVVAEDYKVSFLVDEHLPRWQITVPKGMLTDLTSVPRVGRWFVGRVGPHLEAAIVHDFLFIAWQDLKAPKPKVRDFEFANEVMRVAMKQAKVHIFKRRVIIAAVSSFVGWSIFRGCNAKPRYIRVPEDLDAASRAVRVID